MLYILTEGLLYIIQSLHCWCFSSRKQSQLAL